MARHATNLLSKISSSYFFAVLDAAAEHAILARVNFIAPQVHVDKCVSKNVFIGVAMKRAALANYVGSDLFGWGYLANKAVWHNRGKVNLLN